MWTYYDLLTKLEKKGTETLCLKTPSDFGLLPLFSPEFLDVCSLPKCTGLGFGKLIWNEIHVATSLLICYARH